MKRSCFFFNFANSRRGASKETVLPILAVVGLVLLILVTSYEKKESYIALSDNGKIYVVTTKHWGYKELYRSKLRYNIEQEYWEMYLGDGEWIYFDQYDMGDPVERDYG